MSRWRNITIAFGTVGLVTIGINTLAPKESEMGRNPQTTIDEQIGDLSDADQNNKDRHRDEANDSVDAENEQRNTPGEHRPPEHRPRFRLP
jgi:hypothetical protein